MLSDRQEAIEEDMRWTASGCCGHCCDVRVAAIQAGALYGVLETWVAAMCGRARLPPGICLGCPFRLFSYCLEFWKWPRFQVVLATGLAGEEGHLLLELSLRKCLSRNKHGSHLNRTAAVDLTKQTRRQELVLSHIGFLVKYGSFPTKTSRSSTKG